jgi:secreted trypsin-like serine protease
MKFFVCLALTALVAATQGKGMRNPAEKVIFDAAMRSMTPAGTRRSDEFKINGGADATLGQFPWQGSMQWEFFGHICGLSILSETHVVTAAHCVEAVGEDPAAVTVLVGTTKLDEGGQSVGVSRIFKHEDYDSFNIVNDVAILELATPLQLDENVQPITLGVGRNPTAEELKCTISGWGATDSNGFEYPNDLQFLDVTFYTDERCQALWGSYFDADAHMCAGTESGDNACFGDSGGPLVCETEEGGRHLFGATSWGSGVCGQPETPTVWTELVNYFDWIVDKTGDLPVPE